MWRFNAKVRVFQGDNYRFCLSDLRGRKCVCFGCLPCMSASADVDRQCVRKKKKKTTKAQQEKPFSVCQCSGCSRCWLCVLVRKCETVVKTVISVKPLVRQTLLYIVLVQYSLDCIMSLMCLIYLQLLFNLCCFLCIPAVRVCHKTQWNSSETLCSYITKLSLSKSKSSLWAGQLAATFRTLGLTS